MTIIMGSLERGLEKTKTTYSPESSLFSAAQPQLNWIHPREMFTFSTRTVPRVTKSPPLLDLDLALSDERVQNSVQLIPYFTFLFLTIPVLTYETCHYISRFVSQWFPAGSTEHLLSFFSKARPATHKNILHFGQLWLIVLKICQSTCVQLQSSNPNYVRQIWIIFLAPSCNWPIISVYFFATDLSYLNIFWNWPIIFV